MTFSIVARDGDALGVAVASKFLAAGALVPWARAGAGALATQAYANLSYGPQGLDLLSAGSPAASVVEALTSPDEMRSQRQLGVVDSLGGAATFTGEECMDWAGGGTGEGYSAQGNILAGPHVVDAICEAFVSSAGGALAERLLAALTAGDAAGGDRRGKQAAGLLVVSPAGGYGGTTDVVVDLRVDDHPEPCAELARLLDLHHLYFDKPKPEDLIELDGATLDEVRSRLDKLGYETVDAAAVRKSLDQFAGWENLEERLVETAHIDRHILDALRARG